MCRQKDEKADGKIMLRIANERFEISKLKFAQAARLLRGSSSKDKRDKKEVEMESVLQMLLGSRRVRVKLILRRWENAFKKFPVEKELFNFIADASVAVGSPMLAEFGIAQVCVQIGEGNLEEGQKLFERRIGFG